MGGAERMNEYMPTDKQYDGQLIKQYQMLNHIRVLALKEKATETIKAIDEEIGYIKLMLKPLVLPEDEIMNN